MLLYAAFFVGICALVAGAGVWLIRLRNVDDAHRLGSRVMVVSAAVGTVGVGFLLAAGMNAVFTMLQ